MELTVIKCGGSTMEQLPSAFFETIADLQRAGHQLVIVHGGGPAINGMLQRLQIAPQFVDGLRVTCEQTLEVVEMVLCGTINKQLVRKLTQAGGKAWGVSGIDGSMLTAKQTDKPLGWVGDIAGVDTTIPTTMLRAGYVPVIAPLAVSADGEHRFNVNADVAAGAIAAALSAERLVMVTDVPGILQPTAAGEKELLREASAGLIRKMIADGVIYGGMIPKVQAALDALSQGVKKVVICQSKDLNDICSGKAAGTTITGGEME